MPGYLQVGLSQLTYYMGFSPLLNWWHCSLFAGITRSGGADSFGFGEAAEKAAYTAGYLDDNRELKAGMPADALTYERILFVTPLTDHFAGEQFTVTWTGATSGVGVDFAGATIDSADYTARTVTFTLGAGPNVQPKIVFNISDVNDPPKNIKVFQTRYASNVANGEKFNPDWLAEISQFKRLRFMGWTLTNDSLVIDYSDIQPASVVHYGSYPTYVLPSGTIPLQLIVDLAEASGCDVWVNIPHKATPACVTSMASFFRDNIPAGCTVIYEYSNECWNPQFGQNGYCNTQGSAVFTGDDSNTAGRKWYGYQSAVVMNLIRDAYGSGSRSRWRGVLGAQTVVPTYTQYALDGIAKWETDTGSALAVSDLFDEIAVTGYFGDVLPAAVQVTNVALEANALVTTGSDHGLSVGDEVRFGFGAASGMDELCWQPDNKVVATVTSVPSSTTFRIDLDTSAYAAMTGTDPLKCYVANHKIFAIAESSETQFVAGTQPTKYQYFAEQVAQACDTGACSSGNLSVLVSISSLNGTYWPAQKALADANGLALSQYEGGCHFLASQYISQNGGDNPLGDYFTEFLVGSSHYPEFAFLFGKAFSQFIALGGICPSKFQDAGPGGPGGTWGGMRWLPEANFPDGDKDNPVWTVTQLVNRGGRRFKVT